MVGFVVWYVAIIHGTCEGVMLMKRVGQYLILSEEEAMKLDDPVTINGKYIAE